MRWKWEKRHVKRTEKNDVGGWDVKGVKIR